MPSKHAHREANASLSFPQGQLKCFSGMFSIFAHAWKAELFSKYAIVSDDVPCGYCLVYARRNVQAVGGTLFHLSKMIANCDENDILRQRRKTQILFGFAPMRMHETCK